MEQTPQSEANENWNNVADELDVLQRDKNNGHGVSHVKTIIAYLRRGDIKTARIVCWNENDKFHMYSDIKKFVREKLFAGIADHPWKFSEALEAKKNKESKG
ncbi:MAG TPA: hypothetical protein VJK04_00255 [Candidatus Paceibacterota bacterium]